MRTRATVMAIIGLVLAAVGTAAAEDATDRRELDALLPAEIGEVTMHRMPTGYETVYSEGLLGSGQITALLQLFGLDADEQPVAIATNIDLQPYLAFLDGDADQAIETLTDTELEALLTWRASEVFLAAMPLSGTLADELLDALVELDPAGVLGDATVAGRRIVSISVDGLDPQTEWAADFAVGDVLYVAYSYLSQPSSIETLAAIPEQR